MLLKDWLVCCCNMYVSLLDYQNLFVAYWMPTMTLSEEREPSFITRVFLSERVIRKAHLQGNFMAYDKF